MSTLKTRSTKALNTSENSETESEKFTKILKKLDDLQKLVNNQMDIIKKQSITIEKQSDRIELLEKTVRIKTLENTKLNTAVCNKSILTTDRCIVKDSTNVEKNANKTSIIEEEIHIQQLKPQKDTTNFEKNTDKTTIMKEETRTQKSISQSVLANKNEEIKIRSASNYIIKGTGNTNTGSFAAAARSAWLYVGNVSTDTTNKNIVEFLTKIFPNHKFSAELIEKGPENRSKSNSFKVGFNMDILHEVTKPEIWPKNIIVKRFRFFRQEKPKQQCIFSEQ